MFNPTEEESQSTVTESRATLPNLSSEARIVLKESSLDAHGTVLWINHMGGTLIQVNDKQLIDSPVRREVARWESAVQELVNKELLVSSGQKGEIFQITNLGYQVADMIEL